MGLTTRENIQFYLTSHHTLHLPPLRCSSPLLPAIPPDTLLKPLATATCPESPPLHHVYTRTALPDGSTPCSATILPAPAHHHAPPCARDKNSTFCPRFHCALLGHANFGKGIIFPTRRRPHPHGTRQLPPRTPSAPKTPSSPADNGSSYRGGADGLKHLNVQCNLFGYLGCRTDLYFRDIWQAHFPRVDFVATTYVTHSIAAAPAILHTWLTGLQRGHSLAAIIHDLNQNQSAEILFGRINETTRYHNPATHPAQLFTH